MEGGRMLASLTIKNVVLIDQISIEFSDGLCVLTGETGAGKSILLDSLILALGARSDAGLVRKGQEQAVVTAFFELPPSHPIQDILQENDLEFDSNIILRRSVSSDGRSKAFINDQPVSIGLLKKVGEMLVEIHGQFDTQRLLQAHYHLDVLDEYAEHQSLLNNLSEKWDKWKNLSAKLEKMQKDLEKAQRDEVYFRSSLEDLDALAPKAGEEESLSALRDQLMRREQILENLNIAQNAIQEIETVSNVVWKALNRLGQEGHEAISAMDRANAEIQEVSSSIEGILSDIENSESSLEEIDDRLFALKAQAKKHGCKIDDLSQKREEIFSLLQSIESNSDNFSNLMRDIESAKKDYEKEARKLSEARKKQAKKLANNIIKELPPLKLDKVQFDVDVTEIAEQDWSKKGIDRVEFLISTNPGAALGPLNKIASGGELARLMLAIKVVLSGTGAAGSLVFDEVDSGIGGATAAAVGERLAKLSQDKQILVVTHSPQVAARAKNHWIVIKDGQDVVKTNIVPLCEMPQRREEIARMISGAEITEEARAAADKLLQASAA